jgi:DNA-directed RNA polymerase III subunit RPC1
LIVLVLTFGLMCVDQVAAAIQIVLKSSQPNLVVKLDMQLIETLHMGISADSVQLSILNHPKIKLKSEV